LEEGYVELRTHRGWIRIVYRSNRQLHRYLYSGWRPSSELRLKIAGGRILIYLTLTKEFEVSYNPDNAVSVDINENNVTPLPSDLRYFKPMFIAPITSLSMVNPLLNLASLIRIFMTFTLLPPLNATRITEGYIS